jgi:hypothetical protein
MLNFYYYDTATGRVLARGSYDERGDGAAARAIAVGTINPSTEYAPAGVKTARPLFAPALAIDKLAILADATDQATISNITAGTIAKIYKDQDALPRAVATVNDGALAVRADTAGAYLIVLSNFPAQEQSFTVQAT